MVGSVSFTGVLAMLCSQVVRGGCVVRSGQTLSKPGGVGAHPGRQAGGVAGSASPVW
ncbi:hypothetical protein GCM10009562_20370 [Nocardioides aquaticus]